MLNTRHPRRQTAGRLLLSYTIAAAFCLILVGTLTRPAAAQGYPSVKIDNRTYPDPSSLPALPAVNVKFRDAVFGTEIIRATDQDDCANPGCSTYYSNWPVFNSNSTYILFRNSNNGNSDGRIRAFDPSNFAVVGASFYPGTEYVLGVGGVVMDFQSAYWHPTNPNVVYCFPNTAPSPVPMALYTFTIDGTPGVYNQVKDFSSLRSPDNGGSPNDYLAQMSMSADGNVFAFNVRRYGLGNSPVAYLVWNKTTDQYTYTLIPNQDVNEVNVDKSGQYLYITKEIPDCAGNGTCPHFVKSQVKTLSTGNIENLLDDSSDHVASHGGIGTGIAAGGDSVAGGYNVRSLSTPHSFTTVFDGKIPDCNPADPLEEHCVDWTNEPTSSLHSNDESWMTISTHKSWDSMVGQGAHKNRHLFEKEIVLLSLDGSGRVRRLAHTYSDVAGVSSAAITLSGFQPSAANDYWAVPHASISKDGRFIAYTSNWGNMNRYDLFILKVPNRIEESQFFVHQHYLDFLNREPDASGLQFWTNEIESCPDAPCGAVKRVNVSAAFFLSIEFQQTGSLVYRMHKAGFGNLAGKPVAVRRTDFLADTQQIGGTPAQVIVGQENWQAQLEANKQAFALAFIQRAAFQSAHGGQAAAAYVDSLFANVGVTPTAAERQAAIDAFGSGGNSGQAASLRSVAESNSVSSKTFNESFVLMEYFGYLRRNPDDAPDGNFGGYNYWLGKLNDFNGDYIAAELVKAFINSDEYRQRFGPN